MTTAERLRAQGRAQGLTQGLTRGRAEGLLDLLDLRFGEVPPPRQTQVLAASLADIERWSVRARTAATLDDVFTG